jgi:hypothetical protein
MVAKNSRHKGGKREKSKTKVTSKKISQNSLLRGTLTSNKRLGKILQRTETQYKQDENESDNV